MNSNVKCVNIIILVDRYRLCLINYDDCVFKMMLVTLGECLRFSDFICNKRC